MGTHHAPHSPSSSQAARLAGRGAFTAAAALALAGGTASLAFADEAPSVPTTHELAGHATHGAQDLTSHAKGVDASSTPAAAKPAAVKHAAATPAAASSLPISAMSTDVGHEVANTKTDAAHGVTNWSGAMKGGLTSHEASDQAALMKQDASHAQDNVSQDLTHWSGALTGTGAPAAPAAPQLGSVLTFS